MKANVRLEALHLAIAWASHIRDIYKGVDDPSIVCIQEIPEWATFDEALKELEGEAE